MSTLDLEPIKERLADLQQPDDHPIRALFEVADLAALVAEVERLRATVIVEQNRRQPWVKLAHQNAQEVKRLRKQVESVKELHRPVDMYLYAATPKVCATCVELWPCQTAQALDVE